MNHSKNIQEKIKLYNINLIRNNNLSIKKNKKINSNSNQDLVFKKQSKIKIFFKFLLGFIGSFFEYLVIESNKKNFIKNTQKSSNLIFDTNKNNIKMKEKKDLINEKNNVEEKNIEINIKNDIKKTNENNIDIINKTIKIDKKERKLEIPDKNIEISINEKKQNNNLKLIEEAIIYSDTKEELNKEESKINALKINLIMQKQNNISMLNNFDDQKVKYNKQTKFEQSLEKNQNNDKEYLIEDNIKEINNKENLKVNEFNNSDFFKDNDLMSKERKKIVENNIVVDKLIKRCDEDLVLVSEKKNFLNLQENFEKNFNNEITYKKINKKDLKRIKDSVFEIVLKQKENLKQFNDFMKKPYDSTMFSLKISNFFKSTTKLAFSFVPFFSFPNKIFGLATSALFFNRSIKSYRIKPNKNDINQNIRSMINNNEMCLNIGISNCNDSLNEIENIKYYLKNLSNETKDSIEYRKYLLSVESTEKLIQKQIEIMKKMSKQYDDIKIKVKRREN